MTAAPPKRGRPPMDPAQRKPRPAPRSIRLSDDEWAELQRRGIPALKRWLSGKSSEK